MYHTVIDSKTAGESAAFLDEIRTAILKFTVLYPQTLARVQNSVQNSAERFKDVPLPDANKTIHQDSWQQTRIAFKTKAKTENG